jgi:hypothetical protein
MSVFGKHAVISIILFTFLLQKTTEVNLKVIILDVN